MSRPRLYLDVDGVINAFYTGETQSKPWPEESYRKEPAMGHHIRWSADMIDALNQVILAHGVELVWTTTWKRHALNRIAPMVGLPATRFIDADEKYSDSSTIQWKGRAVTHEQSIEMVPFVWVDDDHDAPSVRSATILKGLAIRPDPWFGITPDHIKQMHEYYASVTNS